jgi:hypothetical protein
VKKWYQSKTLWANIIGLVVMGVEYAVGVGWLAIGAEGIALSILNGILRLMTNQPITFSDSTAKTGSGDAGQK